MAELIVTDWQIYEYLYDYYICRGCEAAERLAD